MYRITKYPGKTTTIKLSEETTPQWFVNLFRFRLGRYTPKHNFSSSSKEVLKIVLDDWIQKYSNGKDILKIV